MPSVTHAGQADGVDLVELGLRFGEVRIELDGAAQLEALLEDGATVHRPGLVLDGGEHPDRRIVIARAGDE